MTSKGIVILGLFLAMVLLISSKVAAEELAETSNIIDTSEEAEKTNEAAVNDEKYPGGGYPGLGFYDDGYPGLGGYGDGYPEAGGVDKKRRRCGKRYCARGCCGKCPNGRCRCCRKKQADV